MKSNSSQRSSRCCCDQLHPRKRSRSTAPARRSRTRSIRSGSTSTTRLHPNAEINYQSIGSGGGIRQLTAGTVFFGASDGPMTNEQILAAGFPILHLPTVLGGVVPVYEIPGVTPELRFTGAILADIFLGKITKWNDAAIRDRESRRRLCRTSTSRSSTAATAPARATSGATTSRRSRPTGRRVGVATSVNWPVGVGGKGNEGVAGLVKQTPGAIGYVELIYAMQNKIPYGSVQNQAGEFVRASTETVSNAAAAAAKNMPKDFRVSITNAPGKNVYPISSFTWLLVLVESRKTRCARASWSTSSSGRSPTVNAIATDLGYAPLPKEVVALEMEALKRIE